MPVVHFTLLTIDSKFNRKIRFLGNNQALLAEIYTSKKNVNTNRRMRFPGGTDTEKIRLLEKEEQRIKVLLENKKPT